MIFIKQVKILTIGNSFADNATDYIEEFAKADNFHLVVGKANLGGCSLEKHYNLILESEKFEHLKPYNFYKTGCERVPMNLKEILTSENWDYVTLQQVSDKSINLSSFFPYIEHLKNYIEKYSPKSEILIHQTWAYRSDADEYLHNSLDQRGMTLLLKDSYKYASKKLGNLRILPNGRAMELARSEFNYKHDAFYDYNNPIYPLLPNQSGSLIRGYFWIPGTSTENGLAKLCIDGRHTNDMGSFLVSGLFYAAFSGRNLENNTFLSKTVSCNEAKILKKCINTALREEWWEIE